MRIVFTLLFIVASGYLLFAFVIRGPAQEEIPQPALTGSTTLTAPTEHEPEPGSIVQIELKTGAIIRGVIKHVDAGKVILDTAFGELVYTPEQLSPKSRRLIFGDSSPTLEDDDQFRVVDGPKFLQDTLKGEDPSKALGFGSNVQYVIMRDKAIFIYGK